MRSLSLRGLRIDRRRWAGARLPAPSLGSLLSGGQRFLPVAPSYALPPGAVLLLISLNFVTDTISEATDT